MTEPHPDRRRPRPHDLLLLEQAPVHQAASLQPADRTVNPA